MRERVCVCVCKRESEREREKEKKIKKKIINQLQKEQNVIKKRSLLCIVYTILDQNKSKKYFIFYFVDHSNGLFSKKAS